MLGVHTAHLSTLVPATRALLAATFLTGKHQFIFAVDRSTWNLLAFTATSALNGGGESTRATFVLMAEFITQMNGVNVTARQWLAADLSTGWNRVSATPSLWIAQLQQLG